MSMVFGVKIILQDKDDPIVENTDIGLYNVLGDNSEFRWLQNSIAGISTWASGIILEKGIKPFSIEIDLKRGGAVSTPGSGSISVRGDIALSNVNFNGLKCEIWLFTGTTPVRYRTYKCGEPSWDSREYSIPLKGAQEDRNVNILNTVTSVQFPKMSSDTSGKRIPATFGRHFPRYDSTGTMIRKSIARGAMANDSEDDTQFTNAYFEASGQFSTQKEFPVTFKSSAAATHPFVFGEVRGTVRSFTFETPPAGTYVKVISGAGEGQYREIEQIERVDATKVCFHLKAYFGTALNDQTEASPSWIKVVNIDRNYLFDSMACRGFLDENGGEIIQNPLIFTENNNAFAQAMRYGYESLNVTDANNQVKINPTLNDTNIDTLESVIITSVPSVYALTTADLSAWNHSTEDWWDDYKYSIDGVYIKTPITASISGTLVSSAFTYDRNSTTYLQFNLSGESPAFIATSAKCIGFTLPTAPEADWDELYIGIKMESTSEWPAQINSDSSIRIMLRKWKYGAVDILNDFNADETGSGAYIGSLPDFYYFNTVSNYNRDFFRAATADGDGKYSLITGYTAFKADNVTKDNYGSFVEGIIVFGRYFDTGVRTDELKLYELALIFKKSGQDISSAIYSAVSGRKFGNTWSSRKTAADLISKPGDILEHICRLQDWRDMGPTPLSGWGLQYATSPLIATIGYGSFDSTDMAVLRNYEAARQIVDEADGYTNDIKETLCQSFDLASWTDADGYERVLPLPTAALPPVYTVTLSDILDRTKIRVYEPRQTDLFSEPYIRYDRNPASGDYEKQITIRNASASIYMATYVDGVENTAEAQALWNSCHSIALLTRQCGKPPENLTDLPWATGPGGYSIALSHLQRWVRWQTNTEIEFPLHFNTAGSWTECTPINIVFSRQTAGIVKSALVESSTVNPNSPYDVMLRAIIYA